MKKLSAFCNLPSAASNIVVPKELRGRQRFYILDPLRLLAAFAVVFYHYLPFLQNTPLGTFLTPLKYGYLGVNFFFMLSGFVIMASCQNRGAFKFAFARAIRLYPAFIACLLITLLIVFLCSGKTYSFLQVFSNALIVNDYIGQPNIDDVYWTLQAELKFYACIFTLILLGAIRHWQAWLSVWLLVAITHHFWGQPFFLGWFISPAYSFYFIGGVCAYFMSKNPESKLIFFMFLITFVFACIKSFFQAEGYIKNSTFYDGIVASSVVFVFFSFFFFLAKGYMQIQKRPYWLLMGAVSYPLYLIHNMAGKTLINYLSHVVDLNWAIILSLLCVCVVAVCIFFFIERRFVSLYKS